jgi:hypothetical protein
MFVWDVDAGSWMLGYTEAKQKGEHFGAVNGISKVDYIHLT